MNKKWKTFWYRPNRFQINFGDEITPVLFRHYGLNTKRIAYAEADIFATGTILGWGKIKGAIILGSGMDSHAGYRPDVKKNKIYGLRGKNTAELLGIDWRKITIGDPGLLMSRVVPKPASKYEIGIVPNSADWKEAKRLYEKLPVKIICPHRQTILGTNRQTCRVVKDIASCKLVLSSSLHGNIIADTYGIPNVHIRLGKKVSEEKFRDYYSIYHDNRYNSIDGRKLKALKDMTQYVKKAYIPVSPVEMEKIKNKIESMFYKLKSEGES